jgi:ankyrin repeat protein
MNKITALTFSVLLTTGFTSKAEYEEEISRRLGINPAQIHPDAWRMSPQEIDERALLHKEITRDEAILFLHRGANPNTKNENGFTPLHFANSEMTEVLLKHLATDVNLQHGPTGYTALHHAACHSKMTKLNLLLNHRTIDVNIRNDDGKTALHEAVLTQNLEVTAVLLSHPDIDVNAKSKQGQTVLDLAAAHCDTELIKLLKAHGAKSSAELQ